MDRPAEDTELFKRAKDFLEAFKKGEEFTKEVLQENERLRFKFVNLEEKLKSMNKAESGDISRIQSKLSELQSENESLQSRYKEVEAENRDFVSRYVEVEEENNNLANLYVASYQLHSTLDFQEVVRIIIEIIINLVGADKFSVLVMDETAERLQVVASEGLDDHIQKKLRIREGIIGKVIQTGESYFDENPNPGKIDLDLNPAVCIPLKIKESVIGVLVIFSLFEQKKEKLTRVDYELFSMLAGHAATALFSSKLYSQSERKLSTIQGFLDLLSGRGNQEG